jgi:hypothetical protein
MNWNFFSFFLSEEGESFLQFNPNLLETNLFNILILIGILVYANNVSFSVTLRQRQTEIIQAIENAQNDVVNASNYYYEIEKGLTQSLFWLQTWKVFYQKEKIDIIERKYEIIKKGLKETFLTTDLLISTLEKKAFLSLQRYVLYLTVSTILQRFLVLTTFEQSRLIELILLKLGGNKK